MNDIVEKTKKFSDLIEFINVGDIAMLTTQDADGQLHSRPMEICHVTDLGQVFFFTTTKSDCTQEITENGSVNLCVTRQDDDEYLSISGAAYLSQNIEELRNFWRDEFYEWIPDGVEDPAVALLKVKPVHAEHWGKESGVKNLAKLFIFGADEPKTIHETMDS